MVIIGSAGKLACGIVGALTVVVVGSIAGGYLKFDDGMFAGVTLALCLANQIMLAVYGINSFILIWLSFRRRRRDDVSKFSKLTTSEYPAVTIQLPIYNERYVIVRLLRRVVEMDWPADKLEIQVLDDSTDGTEDIVAECVDDLRKTTKVKLVHLRRDNRAGYKAGALAVGTAVASGEFIAIFDADFMPNGDFLKRMIPVLYCRPEIGCCQARWGHLNYSHSLFTRLQAIGHDGHFVIEQYAKDVAGLLFNFNGTAGVWRRKCINDAGGWNGDTLAEDLDLSYRAQLKGWRFTYLRDVEVKAEVPLSISAFKKQQFRWAKGSIQTALKLVEPVCSSPRLSLPLKIEALIHLFSYSVHPLMVLNLIFTIIIFFLVPPRETDTFLWITAVIAIGPPMVVALAQTTLEQPQRMLLMPLLVLLHHGLCLSNSYAVLQALLGVETSFERTPKFGAMANEDQWHLTRYAASLKAEKQSWWPRGEMYVFIILIMCILSGITMNVNQYTYPWLFFFSFGFGYVIYLHWDEHRGAIGASTATATSSTSSTLSKGGKAVKQMETSKTK